MLASDYLLLGIDSAVVGAGVVPLLDRRRSQITFAVACGVADGVGSTLGTLIGRPWGGPGDALPALLLVLYGLGVIAGSFYLRLAARRPRPGAEPRTLPGLRFGTCLGLPVLLSLDNLIYPTPDLGVGQAIGLAASSAGLMLTGLTVGRLIAARWRRHMSEQAGPDLWIGAGFVIAGLMAVVA